MCIFQTVSLFYSTLDHAAERRCAASLASALEVLKPLAKLPQRHIRKETNSSLPAIIRSRITMKLKKGVCGLYSGANYIYVCIVKAGQLNQCGE